MEIKNYKALIFDCDGVILNSNKIKTDAFYDSVKKFGHNEATQLVNYHIKNGGLSRYKKFEHFFKNILILEEFEYEYKEALRIFSSIVRENLEKCDISSGLYRLFAEKNNQDWAVVSGSDQIELRELFKKRNLIKFFNLGVFGSPRSKEKLIQDELADLVSEDSVAFIGDSKLDYLVSKKFKFDFIFCYEWTEFVNYKSYIDQMNIKSVKNLNELKI
jgi:phosphoglycolate phosphatase-like HAD superfamily hydrolase